MVMWILIAVAVLVVLFLVIVAMQPAEFEVARSATINTPPARVFEQVNDFHNWPNWSPWEKLDPNMQRTHDGPPSGVGAFYGWVGAKNVGQGQMTIMESRPAEFIRIKLEFLKPFKATNDTRFTFKPVGNQTHVNWTMRGTRNFLLKGMGLFMSMDKMVGPDFEKGLAGMKSVCETPEGRAA